MQISESQLKVIREIFDNVLPAKTEVVLFGSRACDKARKYSDVDLALQAEEAISIDLILKLYDRFEESDLPFRVEIVDLRRASPDMSDEIKKHGVRIW